MTFHGVRGSTACHGRDTARFGGNTSCVSVDAPGAPLVLLDLGTGSRYVPVEQGREILCLVSHLHWDHIQGLPFFPPMLDPDTRMTLCAPAPADGQTLSRAMSSIIREPVFPVGLDAFPARPELLGLGAETRDFGKVRVRSAEVAHVGRTLGYRIDVDGISIAYASDHQEPMDGGEPDRATIDLCRDVDLLIHDSQFTAEQLVEHPDWGHCTPEFALEVARQAGAKRVVLFHHDPERTDGQLDELAACHADSTAPVVWVAREGMTIELAER